MSAIIVENLSKRYVIGHEVHHDTLRDALSHGVRGLWAQLRQKKLEQEEFWALRDVSFEVQPGEVLGIIGRNGAGKSTLLKILSRITEPTTGSVRLRGRVASLLEVGTGFHPELSGRENIFLNGAILGMSRVEITRKFDEIVAFAEVERFLDTPVKRYSSGMYVRLAFAVAAHLEPEILIIDEVLAVGDGAFQSKCLGKIRDISRGDGRSVLFVSHNLPSVRELTDRCMLLTSGRAVSVGFTPEVLETYAKSLTSSHNTAGKISAITEVQVIDAEGYVSPPVIAGPQLRLRLRVQLMTADQVSLEFRLHDLAGTNLGFCNIGHYHHWFLPRAPGNYECELTLKLPPMASGNYGLDVCTHVPDRGLDHYLANALLLNSDSKVNFANTWDLQQQYRIGHFVLDHQPPTVRRL